MDESPIFSRTPRKSRLSLYQSDYETAAEDSDSSSLYYSIVGEDKENDSIVSEDSMTPHTVSSNRNSLLGKCLQKNLNLTPRNEFNKRVSFNLNPFLPSTSFHSPAVNTGSESKNSSENRNTKKSKNWNSSNSTQMRSTSIREIITETVDSEHILTNDTDVAFNIIETIDRDQSLNSTIVANFNDSEEQIIEAIRETSIGTIEESPMTQTAVTSTSTLTVDTRGTNTGPTTHPKLEEARNAYNRNISTTFGLSNLPIPKKITIADLSNPQPVTYDSRLPRSSRMSLFHGHSTDLSYGFSKPKVKTAIPRVSTMARKNQSVMHTSVLPVSSLKCRYCDKSFAKKFILDVHLLEKCDKIPPARHRQLTRQQTCPDVLIK